MRTLVVGVGDARLSGDKGVRLVTYALASCVGIAIYDSVSGVGGIVHYLLPDSRLDRVKAKELPWMFADSAIPMFFGRRTGWVRRSLVFALRSQAARRCSKRRTRWRLEGRIWLRCGESLR